MSYAQYTNSLAGPKHGGMMPVAQQDADEQWLRDGEALMDEAKRRKARDGVVDLVEACCWLLDEWKPRKITDDEERQRDYVVALLESEMTPEERQVWMIWREQTWPESYANAAQLTHERHVMTPEQIRRAAA